MGRVWVVEKPDPCSKVRVYEQLDTTYVEGWGREELRWQRQRKMDGKRHDYSLDKIDRDGTMYLAFVLLYRVLGSESIAHYYANAFRWKKILFNFQTGFSFSEREVRHWIDQELAEKRVFGAHQYATQ